MKKIICILLSVLTLLGLSACGAPETNGPELHTLEFVEGKLFMVEDKEYAAVFCEYTNNSGETCMPCDAIDVKAFQNGVELTINVYTGQTMEDAIQCDTSVQTGTTTKVIWLYEIQDYSTVSVEFSNGNKFSFELEKAEETDYAEYLDVNEYSCVVDESFVYYVMYVTNTSEKVLSAEMNVTAFDEAGNMVGAYDERTLAVAPGQTAGMWITFDEWDLIKSFEYVLDVKEETDYAPVYEDLVFDYNVTDNKVVASMTNNGTEAAEYVWVDVVYLKDGQMVNFSELSFMNDNCKLLPGATLSAEGECYYDGGFDEIALAINGRKQK